MTWIFSRGPPKKIIANSTSTNGLSREQSAQTTDTNTNDKDKDKPLDIYLVEIHYHLKLETGLVSVSFLASTYF